MAIYIQLRKTADDLSGVVYEFGPAEEFIGSVFVDRASGEVALMTIDDPKREAFYLPRIRQVLMQAIETGEFPGRLEYKA